MAVDDLKARFGTSVTPVRDALQMLNQEGLITIKPRSGYFVTQTTLKELRDMLELREILEVAAVERAAETITVAQLDALKKIHALLIGRLAAHDAEGAIKAILEEVRHSRLTIMDRIMQEEAANWHVGTGE